MARADLEMNPTMTTDTRRENARKEELKEGTMTAGVNAGTSGNPAEGMNIIIIPREITKTGETVITTTGYWE